MMCKPARTRPHRSPKGSRMTAILQSEAFLLAIGGTLLGGLWAVFRFSVRRYFVTQADYDADRAERGTNAAKLTEAINKTLDRVNALETRVNALPTEVMLHRLELRMEGLNGEQKAQAAQLESVRDSLSGITNNLNLIQQRLMESH